ncbi:MAG: DUF488 family protein [Spirochaetota bacterium]|nr:DUF488 family protein [Spirochaetota bacterium]
MDEKNMQPTYKRQRFLLSYIRQLKEGVTATDIQKLVFIYTMEEKSNYYEFIPYTYGPYSFQLAEDIEILCRDKYLTKDDTHIKAIGEYNNEQLFPVASERGRKLIKKTYREYPYYAINSEIIGRLFGENEVAQFSNKRQMYSQQDQVIFTIGYEGKSVESLMNILIKNDIHLICDVRKNSLSRKFGFSKNKLEHIADRVGIKYVHIPELGIESKKRTSLNSENDYRRLFDAYAKTLPKLKPYLEKLYSLLCEDNRIALMCYEKEPEMCHRHVIRDYFVKTYKTRSMDL